MKADTPPLEGKEYDAADVLSTSDDWLMLTKAAWEASTTFLDTNHRHQFERNVANFQSKHPAGSKYHLEEYATRSRLFRPKTRIATRKNESSLAASLFSSADVVLLEAEDVDDPQKRRDAAFWHEVINYRLNKDIPWFLLSIGAFQEAMVYGYVISKQYWEYEEVQTGEEFATADGVNPLLDEEGKPISRPTVEVIKDRPWIRLIEIENFRFDPAACWMNPVKTSPYLLEVMPMYLGDVIAKMEAVDPKTGQPEWKKASKETILRYGLMSEQKDDTTAKARQDGNDTEADHSVSDFEKVSIIENTMQKVGKDYVYWTIGTGFMLTDPEPIEDVYRQGGRPYVRGICVIEAHKSVPSGTVQLMEQLQAEANDATNLPKDLLKRSLNPMKYVDRNVNFDLHQMLNRTIGGVVMTDDVNGAREEQMSHVPGSAFTEQNRLDADIDDIAGVFSIGSVQTNRQLGETVGGMEMMTQSANKEAEYLIRTFVETWVEPVIGQLVRLEQTFEEDPKIKEMALRNVQKQEKKIAQKEGVEQPEEPMEVPLEEPQAVDVRVNVGFGNLNPDQRIQRLMTGIQTLGNIAPGTVQKLDAEEVAGEIFGALGYKNGGRFYTDFEPVQGQDPMAQIEQMKLQIEGERLKLQQAQIQTEQAKIQMEGQYNQAKLMLEREIAMAKLAAQENITIKQLQAQLGIESQKIEVSKQKAGLDNMTKLSEIERKQEELAFKERTGRQGI